MPKKPEPRARIEPRLVNPGDIPVACFQITAGRAGVFELHARCYAETREPIEGKAHDQKLSEVVKAICDDGAKFLGPGERFLLLQAVVIRNKILHCALKVARVRLAPFGHKPAPTEIRQIRFDTSQPMNPERFFSGLAKAAPFDDTQSVKGNLYGWVWRCHEDGTFRWADSVLRKARDLLDRLSDAHTQEELARDAAAAP